MTTRKNNLFNMDAKSQNRIYFLMLTIAIPITAIVFAVSLAFLVIAIINRIPIIGLILSVLFSGCALFAFVMKRRSMKKQFTDGD